MEKGHGHQAERPAGQGGGRPRRPLRQPVGRPRPYLKWKLGLALTEAEKRSLPAEAEPESKDGATDGATDGKLTPAKKIALAQTGR
jgi:hypothetical protein